MVFDGGPFLLHTDDYRNITVQKTHHNHHTESLFVESKINAYIGKDVKILGREKSELCEENICQKMNGM